MVDYKLKSLPDGSLIKPKKVISGKSEEITLDCWEPIENESYIKFKDLTNNYSTLGFYVNTDYDNDPIDINFEFYNTKLESEEQYNKRFNRLLDEYEREKKRKLTKKQAEFNRDKIKILELRKKYGSEFNKLL